MTDSWRRYSSHSSLPGNKVSSQGHLCFGLPSWPQPSGLRTGQIALGSPLYIEKGLICRYEGTATVPLKLNMWVLPLWMGIFMCLNLQLVGLGRDIHQVCARTVQRKSIWFMQYCQNTCKKATNEFKLPCVCYFIFLRHMNSLGRRCQSEPKRRLIFPHHSFLT